MGQGASTWRLSLDGVRMARRIFVRYFLVIFVLWIVFVLYPNPLNLIISFHRVFSFDGDPDAVQLMLPELPSEPADIEKAVLARIPYRHDWEVYGMPWYCPTVRQAVERGEGDCKSRALVFASVLEAKNITYRVHSSPIHVWVEYDNKRENRIENSAVEFYRYDPETGERQFQIPDIAPSEVADSFWDTFWKPMPDSRKAILFSGLAALVVVRVILAERRRAWQDDSKWGTSRQTETRSSFQ